MKNKSSFRSIIACSIWVLMGLMTIVFSGPIRRYLEMQWTGSAVAASQSIDRRPKMSTRVFKDKESVARLSQNISSPPLKANIEFNQSIGWPKPSNTIASCYSVTIPGASALYLSIKKLQV